MVTGRRVSLPYVGLMGEHISLCYRNEDCLLFLGYSDFRLEIRS